MQVVVTALAPRQATSGYTDVMVLMGTLDVFLGQL